MEPAIVGGKCGKLENVRGNIGAAMAMMIAAAWVGTAGAQQIYGTPGAPSAVSIGSPPK